MILSVEHGNFSYHNHVPILQDVNFTAGSGELIAILGPNGAGKTTLLRCLTGFLRWDSGRSRIDGEDIRTLPKRKLWRRIAYVPQARGAYAALSVREMILLGCTNRVNVFSAPGKAESLLAESLAEELGIQHLLDKNCREISGGELQMVLIARALAAKPELLILDEPESNLDFKNQLIVLDTLSRLASEGICCIFNTHYPTHALTRAGKSLLLAKGGNSYFGDTAEIVTEENIAAVFGVKAVIGEIETDGNIYRSILPLERVDAAARQKTTTENGNIIAVLSVIFANAANSTAINELLYTYNPYIIGRMGMPYLEGGVHIINVNLDAPQQEVQTLAHKLSILPGVNVKTTIAQKGITVHHG